MKKIFYLVLGIAMLVPMLSHATFVPPPSPMMKVASVNIRNSAIVGQSGNTFNLVFTLSNDEGMQSDVRYGVQLASVVDQKEVVVDEKTYDEVLTLPEHSTTKREIAYTAPEQLSGSYKLYIVSQNSKGFPYGVSLVDTIALTATAPGVFIDPQTCVLSLTGSSASKPFTEIISLSQKDTLTLSCSVQNNTPAAVAAQPVFETRYQSVYGEVASQEGGDTKAVSIAAGEKKNVTFTLPKTQKPQKYVVTTKLVFGDQASNTIATTYLVTGSSATINNFTFDKQSYQKGDTARGTLLYSANQLPEATATVAVSNSAGKNCAEPVTQKVTDQYIVSIDVPMASPCKNPLAVVTITAPDGSVLDEAQFAVTQTGTKNNAFIGILALIALLVLTLLLKWKQKKAAVTGGVTAAALVLFVLIPSSKAHADTYTYWASGYRGYMQFVANIDKPNGAYAAGEPIVVTSSFTSQSADSWGITLTASTNGGTPATIFPLSSVAPYSTTGNKSVTLYAPNAAGSYSVDLKLGEEERLIMGSTTNFSTSSQACSLGDPNSHGYYQPLPYNPSGPSVGSILYLSPNTYDAGQPYAGYAGWLAMQYMYSGISSTNWTYSGTYSVQIDNNGKILATINC